MPIDMIKFLKQKNIKNFKQMQKDKTILNLIEKLKSVTNFTLLEFVDYWDADLCAIGLKKRDRLVYISTYNYVSNNLKNDEISYDFDFEIIDESNKENLNVVRRGRNVSEAEFINEVKLFLEV